MKKLNTIIATMMLCAASLSHAEENASPADATNLVKKTTEFYRANGAEKTFAEVSNPKGKFIDRDLYVSVYDKTGKVVAHGVNSRLIGKDVSDLKDASDKYFMKEILKKASQGETCCVNYKWPNPVTKELQEKIATFEQVDGYIFSVGAYKK